MKKPRQIGNSYVDMLKAVKSIFTTSKQSSEEDKPITHIRHNADGTIDIRVIDKSNNFDETIKL